MIGPKLNEVPIVTDETVNLWSPLSVRQVSALLSDFGATWWIAGGFAIDLFVGEAIREHGDIDVVMLRADQHLIRKAMRSWDCQVAYQGKLHGWDKREYLEPPYSDIWCREVHDGPWRLQIMLLDTDGGEWVFKRNTAVRGKLSEFGLSSRDGVRYLRPEIQLLYKAKVETLAKDQQDFEAALPLLDETARRWLKDMLRAQFPLGHAWIDAIV